LFIAGAKLGKVFNDANLSAIKYNILGEIFEL
jgi:hypothetical protein